MDRPLSYYLLIILYLIENYSLMKRTGFLWIVALLLSAGLQGQSEDPFQGITDETVLPMLKHLPYRHGGMNVPASDGRLLYDIILTKEE